MEPIENTANRLVLRRNKFPIIFRTLAWVGIFFAATPFAFSWGLDFIEPGLVAQDPIVKWILIGTLLFVYLLTAALLVTIDGHVDVVTFDRKATTITRSTKGVFSTKMLYWDIEQFVGVLQASHIQQKGQPIYFCNMIFADPQKFNDPDLPLDNSFLTSGYLTSQALPQAQEKRTRQLVNMWFSDHPHSEYESQAQKRMERAFVQNDGNFHGILDSLTRES